MDATGKKAIVTGGSRGIGSGIIACLAKAGYDVATNYRTAREEAEALARQIEGDYGTRCYVFGADLSERDAVHRLLRDATAALGGLDLWVNNAASTQAIGGLLNFSTESFDYLMNLNFRSYFLGIQAAARYMAERRTKGSIINITSIRSDIAYPTDGVYGGIKAAVRRATESFALDLAPFGIRVNCVAPGAIRTRNFDAVGVTEYERRKETEYTWLSEKIPLGRMGMPEDIGNMVVFLASQQADYITGASVLVDGGLILGSMPEAIDGGSIDRGWGIPASMTTTKGGE